MVRTPGGELEGRRRPTGPAGRSRVAATGRAAAPLGPAFGGGACAGDAVANCRARPDRPDTVPAMAPIPTSLSGLRVMVGNLGTTWLSDVISAAAAVVLLVLLVVAFAATTPSFHVGSALAFVATTAWVYALPAAGLTL